MVAIYCNPQFVLPLVFLIVGSFILSIYVCNKYETLSLISVLIGVALLCGLVFICGYEKQQGYKYYVVLEGGQEVDLERYNIEEQKGDLYIITDK